MKYPFYIIILLVLGLVSCSGQQGESVTYEIKPREELPVDDDRGFTRIFLAGTIDMGNSVDWQAQLKEYFSGKEGRYILYNPRRGSVPGELGAGASGEGRHHHYEHPREQQVPDNPSGDGAACPLREAVCRLRTFILPL